MRMNVSWYLLLHVVLVCYIRTVGLHALRSTAGKPCIPQTAWDVLRNPTGCLALTSTRLHTFPVNLSVPYTSHK